jgi:hypothetical protein
MLLFLLSSHPSFFTYLSILHSSFFVLPLYILIFFPPRSSFFPYIFLYSSLLVLHSSLLYSYILPSSFFILPFYILIFFIPHSSFFPYIFSYSSLLVLHSSLIYSHILPFSFFIHPLYILIFFILPSSFFPYLSILPSSFFVLIFLICQFRLPFFDNYFRTIWSKKGYVFTLSLSFWNVKSISFIGFVLRHIMAEP